MFEQAATRTDIHYTYIDEPNGGLAKARNAGARSAQNDVLVFSDDDCFVSPTLLHDYAHEYQTHDVGFVGGQVRPYLASGPRLAVQERRMREHIPAYCFLRTGLIHGANMSIRRETLLECGGFDHRFGVGSTFLSGEDVDVLARILFAGWPGLYAPKPCVWHDHRQPSEGEIDRVRRAYDIGRGAYYMKMMMHRRSLFPYMVHSSGRMIRHLSSGRPMPILRELQGALLFLRYRRKFAPGG